jgi:hypothetical protein
MNFFRQYLGTFVIATVCVSFGLPSVLTTLIDFLRPVHPDVASGNIFQVDTCSGGPGGIAHHIPCFHYVSQNLANIYNGSAVFAILYIIVVIEGYVVFQKFRRKKIESPDIRPREEAN